MIYVHHHLGLGDHIVCNAIVRKIYKDYGKLMLAVKEHNYSSVKQLYKDIDIEFHKVKTDHDCHDMYFKTPTIRIGFERCRPDWEKSFYDQVGMNYLERFSGFFIERDYKREQELEKSLDLPDKFAFVNKNTSMQQGQIKIKTELPIVELKPLTNSIFDWMTVIEKASEIHTVDSSIMHLIRQMRLNCKKFFYDIRKLVHTLSLDNSWETVVGD